MNDKKYIVAGLIIFFILVLFPFWYMRGRAAPAPTIANGQLELTARAKEAQACVRSTEFMKAEHMQLLDVWREAVVREGKRIYVNPKGKEFNMSMTNTCLDCHSNKAEFCDRCHDYASVRPYCWSCHIENPKENT
jgi:hypothetical protein